MKPFVLRILCAVVFLAPGALFAQTFTTCTFKGVWCVFEDGDYCWMATKFTGKPTRQMLLMIGTNCEPVVLLRADAAERYSQWDGLLLRAGSQTFPMVPDDGWALAVSKSDHKKIVSAVLNTEGVFFEGTATNSKRTRKFEGCFKTKHASKAIAAMKKRCVWCAD